MKEVLQSIIVFVFCSANVSFSQSPQNPSVFPSYLPTAVTVNPKLIFDNNIRSVFQDSKGNFWFGTNSAGVYRYNQKSLIQFTVKEGLADNQVVHIQEDDSSNIWFSSGNFKITRFDGEGFFQPQYKVLKEKNKETLYDYSKQDLWFYGGDGVFCGRTDSLFYLPFTFLDSSSNLAVPFQLSATSVYCMLKDNQGNLWFGTQAAGVCKFDGKSFTWYTELGLAGPAVLGIYQDTKGKLWFGNNGNGLFCWDGSHLRNISSERGLGFSEFTKNGLNDTPNLARVYAINEDKEGNIWVGTVDSGVWKLNDHSVKHYSQEDGLPSNAINTIYKDMSGELWYGTDEHGVYTFNGATFKKF